MILAFLTLLASTSALCPSHLQILPWNDGYGSVSKTSILDHTGNMVVGVSTHNYDGLGRSTLKWVGADRRILNNVDIGFGDLNSICLTPNGSILVAVAFYGWGGGGYVSQVDNGSSRMIMRTPVSFLPKFIKSNQDGFVLVSTVDFSFTGIRWCDHYNHAIGHFLSVVGPPSNALLLPDSSVIVSGRNKVERVHRNLTIAWTQTMDGPVEAIDVYGNFVHVSGSLENGYTYMSWLFLDYGIFLQNRTVEVENLDVEALESHDAAKVYFAGTVIDDNSQDLFIGEISTELNSTIKIQKFGTDGYDMVSNMMRFHDTLYITGTSGTITNQSMMSPFITTVDIDPECELRTTSSTITHTTNIQSTTSSTPQPPPSSLSSSTTTTPTTIPVQETKITHAQSKDNLTFILAMIALVVSTIAFGFALWSSCRYRRPRYKRYTTTPPAVYNILNTDRQNSVSPIYATTAVPGLDEPIPEPDFMRDNDTHYDVAIDRSETELV